jgi:hypothetical protein
MATLRLLRPGFLMKAIGLAALLAASSGVFYSAALAQSSEEPRPKYKPKIGKPIKRNNPKPFATMGSLEIMTTPQAKVAYMSLSNVTIKRNLFADHQGSTEELKLKPGKYRLEFYHDDYVPHTENVTIIRGKKVRLVRKLTEKYGLVILAGIPEPAASDVTVRINGEVISPARLKIERNMLSISRIPVGKQRISLSRPEYRDWGLEVEVKPGAPQDNTITVTMTRLLCELTIESQPGAWVYLDSKPKGQIFDTGKLGIPDLPPGKYRVKVSLQGYEVEQRVIELSLTKCKENPKIDLIPREEDAAVDVTFNSTTSFWTPNLPQGWTHIPNIPSGLKVTGNEVGLLKKTSQPYREFNFYRDFTLLLNISFTNGKGAAWVVRAQNERDYYLFELTTKRIGNQPSSNYLNFYVCRNGNCGEPRIYPVVPNIDIKKPGRISLEVKGKRFIHRLVDPDNVYLCSIVEDNTFDSGGVGLRAINGLEMVLNRFWVEPDKRTVEQK